MRRTALAVDAPLAVVVSAITVSAVAGQEPRVVRVAQVGSGDFDTIGAAIGAAADGDTILVAPSTYAEGLEITTAVTRSGDGAAGQIVIAPDLDELPTRELSWRDDLPVAVYVEATDTVIEHLTILGGDAVPALWLDGGAHFVRDTASVARDNTVTGAVETGIVIDGSRPSFVGNATCAAREPLYIVGDADLQIGTKEICGVDDERIGNPSPSRDP